MDYSLLYKGSVKNLYEHKDHILFEYSDRYSLFDWGEMPDHLEQKGESLAMMGALFFTELDKHHIPHHFLGLSDKSGKEMKWKPTRYLKVKKVPVTRPELIDGKYDYSFFKSRPGEGLVPLEVIFRFGVGKGSSLSKRVQQDPSLLNQWHLDRLDEGKLRDVPLIDFSTKLEPLDRYLTHDEARAMAGLTEKEFLKLHHDTIKVALTLRNLFGQMGLELWDGKIEWAFMPGESRTFMLVDSIGLDELRLEQRGNSLSKEFLREHYRQTDWFKKLSEAKSKAQVSGGNFKDYCSDLPPKLPLTAKQSAEGLYMGFTNDLAQLVLGHRIFNNDLSLKNWGAK